MKSGKRTLFLLLIVALFLMTACGGGGGGGGCEHLSCAPETNAMEKINTMLEDAEDGIIDKGESDVGDLLFRAAEWLSE